MRAMKYSGVEWIGEIPESWSVIKNKNCFTCDKTLVGEASSATQLLSLTTKGIKTKSVNAVGGKLPETFDTYQTVDKGDLVMCLFDLDMSAVFSGLSMYSGMISPAYKVLKCRFNTVNRYAAYWFAYIFDGRKFNHYAKNIRYTLSYDEFAVLPMLNCPVDEQQRIADYLDAKCSKIDVIISKQEAVIEKLKAYKQSIITEAVTKGLNPDVEMKNSDVPYIGVIPDHWSAVPISSLFKIKKDIIGREPEVVLSITQQGLKVKDITKNEGQMANSYANYQIVSIGDFAMNHMDLLTGWVDIAKCEGVTSPDYRVFVKKDSTISSEYYLLVFQSYYKNKYFYGSGQGVSNMGRWRLPANNFLRMRVPLPPKDEQAAIAKWLEGKLELIDSNITHKQSVIDKLTEYKKSLIYEVVTGKKEV